jgi:hypothetical protein
MKLILLVVLYGCVTWSLTLRKEHKLRVLVLRRIFVPKMDEVRGDWRLHEEEFCNLYTSPRIIMMIKSRRMKWAGYVVHIGGMRNT